MYRMKPWRHRSNCPVFFSFGACLRNQSASLILGQDSPVWSCDCMQVGVEKQSLSSNQSMTRRLGSRGRSHSSLLTISKSLECSQNSGILSCKIQASSIGLFMTLEPCKLVPTHSVLRWGASLPAELQS